MHTVIRTENGWAVIFVLPADAECNRIERQPIECFTGKLEAGSLALGLR
jgi:hypothetical protein